VEKRVAPFSQERNMELGLAIFGAFVLAFLAVLGIAVIVQALNRV
jgi:hypothetical protein